MVGLVDELYFVDPEDVVVVVEREAVLRLCARGEGGGDCCLTSVCSDSALRGGDVGMSVLCAPGIQPAKKSTTAPTPIRMLSILCLRSSALASALSISGVKTLVSLYPASLSKSSRRS